MNLFFTLFVFILINISLFAQTQTIRGKVADGSSLQPLVGVVLKVKNTYINTITDNNGNFTLEKVPIGRQIIETKYLGYDTYVSNNIIISSSKATYLELFLNENIGMVPKLITTRNKKHDGVKNIPLNNLSIISTRSFSVEETKRYAASIDDPGRLASALPGVQTDQDNENDIIIRGNSSTGVLWRLEGLEVANPSHFSRIASTGGGITAFSAALLGNTDFSTGGFSAEYGNALAGVFDMRFRKGNMVNPEYSLKIGVVGLGFSTEGPIKKGRSSYLVNYRFSTLGVLSAMGIYAVRENVSNNFQDLSFNISFNSKDNKNEFKIFGIGGLSEEIWSIKDTSKWNTILDYEHNKNGSNLGLVGASYLRLLNDNSYLKMTIGAVFNQKKEFKYKPLATNFNIRDTSGQENYKNLKSQFHITYSNKLSTNFRIKTGLSFHALSYWLDNKQASTTFLAERGTHAIMQAYILGSYKPSAKFTINLGVHALFFSLNNTYSVAPRLAIQYKPLPKTIITASYSLHGKTLPIGTYLLRIPDGNGKVTQPNKNLDITKMHHAILSYQQYIGNGFRTNLEFYYQYAFNVAVGADSLSNFSYSNQRKGYGNLAMVSKGQGQNYGAELTVEKAFSRQFFMLITGSLFWSQYKSLAHSDWQRTRTDRRWTSSLMAGYEFALKNKGGFLQVGIKTRLSGGLRYTPANELASYTAGVYVPDESRAFSKDATTYFRLDTRFAYRKDFQKVALTIAVDIQNITGFKNVRNLMYDRKAQKLIYIYEAGLLPILNVQLDF